MRMEGNTVKKQNSSSKEALLSAVEPSRAIVKLAVPATLALLAKAIYNIVDTAYIGMLNDDNALAAVGVTLPLLLIMVSIENIFAAGAAVLAGRQLGAGEKEQASQTVTTIAAKPLPDSDLIIAAYGVVQRLILIGCYVVMGFMQGYQPVAAYAFGAKQEERFHDCVRFALKGALLLTVAVAAVYIALAKPLILLFNRNPLVVEFGKWLLTSQVALYPAFGLCYMMTITFQTIGSSKMGLLLSLIRQGLFYVPFILLLPGLLGVTGIYFSQPAADLLTILVCLFLVRPMKRMASKNMTGGAHESA